MLGKSTKKPAKGLDRSPNEAGDDTSVVSKDMRIIGNCSTEGRLRIHGRITGDVTARALELTSTGSIEGDVAASEGSDANNVFIIDGTVIGTVRATQVEVRRGGAVMGGVVADEAVVRGRVEGGIVARIRLVLDETAVVEGDVRARRLALKEGGEVNGTILMGERATTGLSGAKAAHEASGTHPKEGGLAATAPSELPAEGPKGNSNPETLAPGRG